MAVNGLAIFKGRVGIGEVIASNIPAGTAIKSAFNVTSAALATSNFESNAPASGMIVQRVTDDLSADTFIVTW